MGTMNKMAPVDAWEQVSSGASNVLVSTASVRTVHVHVGTTAPAADAAFHTMGHGNPFSLSGMAGQSVFIRSGTREPVRVTVTTD